MSLAEKPHKIQVAEANSATTDVDGIYTASGWADEVQVYTQISPLGSGQAESRYGLILSRPHQLFCDLADAGYFSPGSRIRSGTRTYTVQSAIDRHEQGDACDYASCLLEEQP